jgi:hypothetical protein
MNNDHAETRKRKEYAPPKIVGTEKLQVRAVACAQSDDARCGAGPIQS